jgi:uncharacterized protein (DUF433 family)
MKNIDNLINIDPEILGGTPVFKGTRVPVESLFDHLEAGVSIEDFLDDFPTVEKAQVLAIIEFAGKFLTRNLSFLYATAA